jgi:bacteriocin biosynthesis cyclodehydratase domain-containing protein
MRHVVTAFESIAETRPRLRRDILFTQTPTGVLFHNAQGGFGLNTGSAYRFASLVVPHLDGGARVRDLAQGLGEPQRDMLTQLISALYEHGFARDVEAAEGADTSGLTPEVAAAFAAQIGYLDHYADRDRARFQRFRGTRVAVLGDDPLARWCALSLVRNGSAGIGVLQGTAAHDDDLEQLRSEAEALTGAGCPVAVDLLRPVGEDGFGWDLLEGYDVVVVTGGSAGPRQLARLLDSGVPEGKTLLPAWTFDGRAVIGPLMEQGRAGCWVCALLRLGANGDAAAAADIWSSIAPGAPREPAAPRLSRPLAGMLGNLLGYEIFRVTTGALPSETRDQLIVQDLESLDVTAEGLLAHPRCRYCSPALPQHEVPDLAALDGATPEALPAAEAAVDQAAKDSVLAELTTRGILVGPVAGVFGEFADEDWNQSPIKTGTLTLGTGRSARRSISAFDLHHLAAARLRVLLRAAEVYAEQVVPVSGVLTGKELEAARGAWPLVEPERIGTASGTGVPADRIPAWARATSLLSGETVLVPVAALRTFGTHNQDRLFEATSAGTGAGSTPAAAAARGLLTALAYDLLRGALRGSAPAARVAPESFAADAELTFLARSAENLGVALELLELGDPAVRPVPVLLAHATDPETGVRHWAVGSALSRRDAAVEAVRDLLGRLQLSREPGAAAGVDTGDPLFRDLDVDGIAVVAGTAPELRSEPGSVPGWGALLDRLRRAGRDVLLAPVVAPDLAAGGVAVVRVLVTEGAGRDDR